MKAYVVWYRNMWDKAEVMDSIWTDKDKGIKRQNELNKEFTSNPDDIALQHQYEKYSTVFIADFELNKGGYSLDLDIQCERDANGYQIEREIIKN